MDLALDTAVQYVKGVGPARARALSGLGVHTVEDLLHHYPRRHEDRTRLAEIAGVREGENVVLRGVVAGVTFRRIRRKLSLVTVDFVDETGALELTWWNQPFRRNQFAEGDELVVTGKVGRKRRLAITNPEVEFLGEEGEDVRIHTGRIVPVYPLTRGISGVVMRRMVHNAVRDAAHLLSDYLPPEWLERQGLPPLASAIRGVHFPESREELADGKHRLKYDELLLFELALALRRRRIKAAEKGSSFRITKEIDRRIRKRIPFRLTGAQERAIREIREDMLAPHPMTRLLQGDVGSGKTAVALYSILLAVANRRQAAVMAPTEILAEQHFRTFSRYLRGSRVRMRLLVGALKAKERRRALEEIAAGDVDVAVGTHALIQKDVDFADLGLVVVDEQHRFGVLQRASLQWKGKRPDSLFLTATPIPRTLTMTLFGDLDVSVVDELPPGRTPVETRWFPPERVREAHELIRKEIRRGRQAFFIFPLVEESEEMPLKAVTEEVERLRREVFPEIPVGLIHGRLSREEKDEAMRAFRAREDLILAATTVVEVGIDVPNATVMVVENAERYGLSQLHQLRGRIGRGKDGGTLVLLGAPTTPEGAERLRIMTETTDGFRIAEEDLRLRGPGEVLGTRQHGMPDLRLADLVEDHALLVAARRDAFGLVDRDPELAGPGMAAVRRELERRMGDRIDLASA